MHDHGLSSLPSLAEMDDLRPGGTAPSCVAERRLLRVDLKRTRGLVLGGEFGYLNLTVEPFSLKRSS